MGSLGVGPARFLTFTVRNLGSRSTNASFTADVYINGELRETVGFPPLGGSSGRRAEARVAKFTDCEKGTIRLVLDPQNAVNEMDEFNNDYSADRVPPCPDVTAIIDQDHFNNNLEYRIQIRVLNEGTARMPAVDAGIIAAIRDPAFGGPTLEQCEAAPTTVKVSGCMYHTRRIRDLAPGQLEKFTIGGRILATKTALVKVTLKCVLGADCLESDGTNNVVFRILGPH